MGYGLCMNACKRNRCPMTHALTHGSAPPVCVCRAKADGPYDSRFLPVLLTVCMVLSMSVVFGGAVTRLTGSS